MTSKTDLYEYIKRTMTAKEFHSVADFARTVNINEKQLTKYLRGEAKFNLHYFMALVESLEINPFELYKYVYQNEKKKGKL